MYTHYIYRYYYTVNTTAIENSNLFSYVMIVYNRIDYINIRKTYSCNSPLTTGYCFLIV